MRRNERKIENEKKTATRNRFKRLKSKPHRED